MTTRNKTGAAKDVVVSDDESHPSTSSASSAEQQMADLRAQVSALTLLVADYVKTTAAARSGLTDSHPRGLVDPRRSDPPTAAALTRVTAQIEPFPKDPSNDLAALYWLQATERSLSVSDLPEEQLVRVACSHIPTTVVAAKSLSRCKTFVELRALLRATFCPNSTITEHMVDIIKHEYDTPLEGFNAIVNLLSLIEYLQIREAEMGPFIQRLIVLSVLNNNIIDELERHVDIIDGFDKDTDHVAFRDKIIRLGAPAVKSKGTAPSLNAISAAQDGPWLARRTGTPAYALNSIHAPPDSKLAAAQATITHYENLLSDAYIARDALLDDGTAYEFNAIDSSDSGFHDHESWALNYMAQSPADVLKLKQAMLKIPKSVRQQLFEAKKCYFCKKPISGPGGHTWRNCPSAPL